MSNHEMGGNDREVWTFESLRQWVLALVARLDQRIDDAHTAVLAALVSAEKAVEKADHASTTRFEAVNEFRAQLSDQAATFVPRQEADAKNTELLRQVAELRDHLNEASKLGLPRSEFEAQHKEVLRLLGQARDEMGLLRQTVAVGPPSLKDLQRVADTGAGRDAGTATAEAHAEHADEVRFQKFTQRVYLLLAGMSAFMGLVATHVIH
jgi:hypothetical protein